MNHLYVLNHRCPYHGSVERQMYAYEKKTHLCNENTRRRQGLQRKLVITDVNGIRNHRVRVHELRKRVSSDVNVYKINIVCVHLPGV
jgi:hypothetical protein